MTKAPHGFAPSFLSPSIACALSGCSATVVVAAVGEQARIGAVGRDAGIEVGERALVLSLLGEDAAAVAQRNGELAAGERLGVDQRGAPGHAFVERGRAAQAEALGGLERRPCVCRREAREQHAGQQRQADH